MRAKLTKGNAMYMWGVTLMTVGGFSFLLPLFGRQFMLVSALGLSGIGATVIGLVLFVIGLLLVIAPDKKVEAPARSTPRPSRPRNPPIAGPASMPMKEAVRNTLKIAPTTSSTENRFSFGGNDYADPYHFGLSTVIGSLENTNKIVVGMIGSGELPSQEAIKRREVMVQMHILALVSATHYVSVSKGITDDKQVLTRLAAGLMDGFAAIFDVNASSESARRNALSIYGLVQEYAHSLAHEFDSLNMSTVGDNPFDMGSTARHVVYNIAGQCEIQDILVESHLERMGLELVTRDCGIFALLKILSKEREIQSR